MIVRKTIAAGIVAASLAFPTVAGATPNSMPTSTESREARSATSNSWKNVSIKIVYDHGHFYKVKYHAASNSISSYIDGRLVNTVYLSELEAQIRAESDYIGSRNSCSIGLGAATIINGALWTAAGVTAPASAGASIAIGGFVTSLIPGVASMFLCG